MTTPADRGEQLHGLPLPTTIEQTSKKYKAGQLIGALMIGSGIVIYVGGSMGLGTILVTGGAFIYMAARVGAWWNNG